MKQPADPHDFTVPMLPEIAITMSPVEFAAIKQAQMARFDGERWNLLGPVIDGASRS